MASVGGMERGLKCTWILAEQAKNAAVGKEFVISLSLPAQKSFGGEDADSRFTVMPPVAGQKDGATGA